MKLTVTQQQKRAAYNKQWRLNNPEKLRAQRQRHYAKYRSGYPRGRPRKGEVRPISKFGTKHKRWRNHKVAADPTYLIIEAKRQRDWKAGNPSRSREISRGTYARSKGWSGHTDILSKVNALNKTMKECDHYGR